MESITGTIALGVLLRILCIVSSQRTNKATMEVMANIDQRVGVWRIVYMSELAGSSVVS